MHFRSFFRSAALGVVIVPLCHGIPIPNAGQYQNVDYEFAVNIPTGLHACMNSSPCPNHGIWVPLGRSHCDSDTQNASPYVTINADYNAAGDADTAWGLAEIECQWRHAKDIVWLRGMKISGREAAGCRRSFDDGHIEVTFIVLRKTDESPLSWIEISADLITTPARYAADLRVFRRVLPGIWVHADGPHY